MADGRPDTRRSRTARRYPPLASGLVAAVVALFVLPSALNVPQSNPTQTLEFAPVPPTDDAPPPPQGNVASVGLGESSTVQGSSEGGDLPPPPPPPPAPPPGGVGAKPSSYRCVGDPPRQTEDPLAPPCVAHFEGDNGGATYQGVSGDEVRVLVYSDCGWQNLSSRGMEYQGARYRTAWGSSDQCDEHVDLGNPPEYEESVDVRGLRALQNYFNSRYQTYGRKLRIIVYFAYFRDEIGAVNGTPEQRRADATSTAEFDPFGVITHITNGNDDVYLESMAGRGILNFASAQRPADFYRQYGGRVWGYQPSLEISARQFTDYVCKQVVGQPVSFTGNEEDLGKQRRLGLLRVVNAKLVTLTRFGEIVKAGVEACGGTWHVDATFANDGQAVTSPYNATFDPNYGRNNIASFRQQDVTTIVWARGYETDHTKAAAQADYYPEWVVSGDGRHDGYAATTHQDQDVFRHAFVVTNQVLAPPLLETQCAHVYWEGDPSLGDTDVTHHCQFRRYYTDLRQLMNGVQVAGPKLTPETLERGFRAIPEIPSGDPAVPACFYEPGDYTCVKDASRAWWDPEGPNGFATGSARATGCWRMLEGGRRYLEGGWLTENVDARRSPDDPCNAFPGSFFLYR